MRALVIIALAASTVATPVRAWVNVHPRTGPSTGDIWADASDNIWVTNASGSLHHFDGTEWTTIPMMGENPRALWGDGGLIYVAGDRLIAFYDPVGGTFTDIGVPPFVDYTSIVAFGANRVMVGANSGAWLWRGSAWDQVNMPVDPGIDDLWGTGAFNIYAAAETGNLYRYTADGMMGMVGNFEDIFFTGTFNDPINTSDDFTHVWGTSANDVYVATQRGAVIHYDGSAAPGGWTLLSGNITTNLLFDAHGTTGRLFAATSALSDSGFHRYDGMNWNDLPGDPQMDRSPRSVWSFAANNAMFVGDGASWRWNGTYFRKLPGSWGLGLREVWAYDDNGLRFVAVGDGGNILTNRNGSHEVMASDSFVDLNDVWGANKDHVWAVGEGGLVRFFNGTTWATVDAGTTDTLYAVWGWAENNLLIAGDNSVLRQYNGSTWADVTVPTPGLDYRSIDGIDASNYFVGSHTSTLFHNNDGTMEETFVGSSSETIHEIEMFSIDSAAVATGDGVAFWNGTWFDLDPNYPRPRSFGIAGADAANVVVASYDGIGGTIHRMENGMWVDQWTVQNGDPFSGADSVGTEVVVVGDSFVVVDSINRLLVNSNDDNDDGNCDTGHCSLREAIDTSNATPGRDLIAFDLQGPSRVISLSSALPALADAVIIDGSTQPGFSNQPVVTLDGGGLVGADGLVCTAAMGAPTLRSLAINGFPRAGIAASMCDGLTVVGNIIGLHSDGVTAAGNAIGVDIVDSNNVTVGGSAVADRNVIAANSDAQIQTNSDAGEIATNLVGVNIMGEAVSAAPAMSSGIRVAGGMGTTIRDNIISGADIGIELDCAHTTHIRTNFIGTNGAGNAAVAGSGTGISITGIDTNVGQPGGAGRNLIAGHAQDGIVFPMNACPAGSSTELTEIYSNRIGVGIMGEIIGNGTLGSPGIVGAGIRIDGTNDLLVGSSDWGDRNEIAYNAKGGIVVTNGQMDTIGANHIHDNDGAEIDMGGDGRDNPDCIWRDFQDCADDPCIGAEIVECTGAFHGSANTTAPPAFLASTDDVIGHSVTVTESHDLGGRPSSNLSLFFSSCVDGVWHIDLYETTEDFDPNANLHLTRFTITRDCSVSPTPTRGVQLPIPAGPALSIWVAATVTSPDGSTSELSNPGFMIIDPTLTAPPPPDPDPISGCNEGCANSLPPLPALVIGLWLLGARRRPRRVDVDRSAR